MKRALDSCLYPAGMRISSSNSGIHASEFSSSSEEGAGRNYRSGCLGVLPSLCRDRGGGRGQQTGVGGRGRRQRQWTGAGVESKRQGQGKGSVFLRNSSGSGDSREEPQYLWDNICHPSKQTLGLSLAGEEQNSLPAQTSQAAPFHQCVGRSGWPLSPLRTCFSPSQVP